MFHVLLALASCTTSDDPSKPSEPTKPGTTPVDPPGTTVPGPSEMTASCAATAHPLRFSCHVEVDPPQPVQIRFGRASGVGAQRIHASPATSAAHDIVLYMMAPTTDYTFTAETLVANDTTITNTFTSGEAPRSMTIAVSGVSSAPYVAAGDPCDGSFARIYDTETGELVWFNQVDPTGEINPSNMVQFTEDHTILAEIGTAVVELDLTGTHLGRLETGVHFQEWLHHDLFKRNGHVYTLFRDDVDDRFDGFHIYDASGTKVATWSGADLGIDLAAAWMHTNAIWVNADGDVFLSSYTEASVLKIVGDWTSPDFGTLVWSLAGHSSWEGFGRDFTIDWSPQAGGDSFLRQHNVSFAPDGRLLMLDNGHGRALLLSLDETALTSTADATYSTGEVNCGVQGTAAATAAGHVFVGCIGPDLLEYEPGGTLVWQAEATCASGDPAAVWRWYPLEGW